QAEDGIRDFHVTGVQTCALPIFRALRETEGRYRRLCPLPVGERATLCRNVNEWVRGFGSINTARNPLTPTLSPNGERERTECVRSEEHTSELQSRENLVCRLLPE